jgi:hypothetical protein
VTIWNDWCTIWVLWTSQITQARFPKWVNVHFSLSFSSKIKVQNKTYYVTCLGSLMNLLLRGLCPNLFHCHVWYKERRNLYDVYVSIHGLVCQPIRCCPRKWTTKKISKYGHQTKTQKVGPHCPTHKTITKVTSK